MSSSLHTGLQSISLSNRPYGNLEYEQKIDQVFLWMENWDLNQINNGIVHFVKESSLSIKRILRTTLEPLLHRDYIYHKFDTGPDISFSPISTYFTRELYEKMERDVNRYFKRRQKEVYRLKSAHLKTEVDVKNWSNESVLPNIKAKGKLECRSKEIGEVKKKKIFHDKSLQSRKQTVEYENLVASAEDMKKDVWNNVNKNRAVKEHPSASLKSVDFGGKIAQSIDSKRPISYKYLFQSPCHATTLQRTKTQLSFPPIKHTILQDKVLPKQDNDVFENFPLSLKTNRRHLQERHNSDCRVDYVKSKVDYLRSYASAPNMKRDIKMSPIMKYKDQVTKICIWISSWNEWQEEYFMRMFLKLLSTTQLYFMYAIVMVQLYCDIISLLPKHLSLEIFQYLRPKKLITCAKVSKNWKSLCLHDHLWKDICARKQIVCNTSSFFKAYSQHQKLNINWRDGRYAMTDFLKQNASVTTLDIYEDLLATASSDKLIKIWKISLGKCTIVLEGHQKVVWGLQFISQRLLLSCSNDQTIKIWNLRTGCCTRTIIGHDGAVWCLKLQGEHFVSGSSDRTAKVWALRSCTLVRSFSNHPGGVYSVAVSCNSQRFITGTIDKTIRIWDLKMTEHVATLQVGSPLGPLAPVTSLSYDKGFLWCACNNDFQVWDIESLQVVTTYYDAHKKIECGQIKIWKGGEEFEGEVPKGRIVSCGKDGKLKIWNLSSTKPILTVFLNEETMPFLLFDDMKIVFSCHGQREATVKMINFSWNIH